MMPPRRSHTRTYCGYISMSTWAHEYLGDTYYGCARQVGDHDDLEEKATMSRLLDALFAGVDDDEGLGGHHHL